MQPCTPWPVAGCSGWLSGHGAVQPHTTGAHGDYLHQRPYDQVGVLLNTRLHSRLKLPRRNSHAISSNLVYGILCLNVRRRRTLQHQEEAREAALEAFHVNIAARAVQAGAAAVAENRSRQEREERLVAASEAKAKAEAEVGCSSRCIGFSSMLLAQYLAQVLAVHSLHGAASLVDQLDEH